MSRDPYDDYAHDDPDRDERERGSDDDRRDGRDDLVIARAKAKVTAPAVGLIVVAAFGLISVVMGIVQYGTLDAQFDAEVKKVENEPRIPKEQKPEQIKLINQIREWAKVGWIPFYATVGVLSLVTLFGGVKLMTLSGRLWPTLGAILAMMPCTSGCCLLGLVFGIWAMIVMGHPDVKAGFAARRRSAYSPDLR